MSEEREVVRICACIGPEECGDRECPAVIEYLAKQESTE